MQIMYLISYSIYVIPTNNVRGYAAIANKICQAIKDPHTINKYLDGRDLEKSKRQDFKIMTDEEEAILVRFLKNKSRDLQGIDP